jgi:hypothetical protein
VALFLPQNTPGHHASNAIIEKDTYYHAVEPGNSFGARLRPLPAAFVDSRAPVNDFDAGIFQHPFSPGKCMSNKKNNCDTNEHK